MGTRRNAAHRTYAVAPSGSVAGGMPPTPEEDGSPPDESERSAETELASAAIRTYRGPGQAVTMPNVSAVRAAVRDHGSAGVAVGVMLDDAAVSGAVRVTGRRGLRYEVEDAGLVCSVDEGHCPHVDDSVEAARALLEARRIRTGLQALAEARAASAQRLGADHEASLAAHTRASAGGGSRWAEDPSAFQAAYRQAQERRRQGQRVVPFVTENATGGLGARNGGRGFGVELEFDIDPGVNRQGALAAIARDMHAEGLIPHARQSGYHSSSDYTRWRFETDATVHGEIVSPVLHDEPQSWEQLAKVCEIVRRHGGRASARAGGHVHVGVGDYDHTVEHHNNLLAMFRNHEDVLYRMAQNPERSTHRGTYWCRPNRVPATPYHSPNQVAANHGNHTVGMNFGAVLGRRTDHVEFRMWDSSLDPGVIQTQVKMSLGLTQAAFASTGEPVAPEPLGSHRSANASLGRGNRLRGEAWQRDTKRFRSMLDRIFSRDVDKEQATALFAATRWQRDR
jgi:hypothetical protein